MKTKQNSPEKVLSDRDKASIRLFNIDNSEDTTGCQHLRLENDGTLTEILL